MRREVSALDQLRRKGPAAPADPIWVPAEVDLVGEDLVWRARDGKVRCREARPGSGLLESFLELRNARPKAIMGFAKRWGPLGLQETNLPEGRSFPWRPRRAFESGVTDTIVIWPGGEYREPVAAWRGWAMQAYALLRICAALRGGRRGRPDDWAFVSDKPWKDVNFEGMAPSEAIAVEWGLVVFVLQEWIARGRVRPNVRYKWFSVPAKLADRSWRLRLSLGGDRLLGALAVQLVFAASRTREIFLCDGCGKEFRPKRNPNANQHQFCARCGREGAPGRLAARAYYARNKAKILERRMRHAEAATR